jgi:hypothetical protein
MPDGLDELTAQRQRRRNIPPSKHPPRSTPVSVPSTPKTATAEETPSELTAKKAQPAPNTKKSQPAPAADPTATSPAPKEANRSAGGEMKKRTIYLTAGDDDWLEEVYLAGRTSPTGRVDANRGAVMRYALRRLQAESTPAEVVEVIRAGINRENPGRPRF